MKLGLLKEYKTPKDVRVALTPSQCHQLMETHPNLQIVAEPYAERCFTDSEYTAQDISLQTDLSDCDMLLGVKEVPVEKLIPNKIYMFFSHTIKMQAYNKKLMQNLLEKNIRMIDYETLVDENNNRIIGFGKWAGIVGAHHALCMIQRKWGHTSLKPANECHDMEEMLLGYQNIKWPPVKIAVTGTGRVGKGVATILHAAGIAEVRPEDFLTKTYDKCVFTILGSRHLYKSKDGSPLNTKAFHADPTIAESNFTPYAKVADVLVNGMFWDFRAPRLFETNVNTQNFHIKLIADITCDVGGSVPFTFRQTSIDQPYFGVDLLSGKECKPFTTHSVDIMAVGNLPNELPRNASTDFGNVILEQVIPEMLKPETSELLARATICRNGQLAERFKYLSQWISE
ncbi:alanine dehydrogenase [bacterium]|nr:alanine dehydrogenase [bacterium]